MTFSYNSGQLFRIGTMILLCNWFSQSTFAQCDFVNDITGLTQATPPTGNAADPTLYTHTYVLVDNLGNIVATNTTPDFAGLSAGLYQIYAVNYDNNEVATILPLLTAGQPWVNVEAAGDDDATFCLDYTTPYSSCPITVCEEMTVCEFETVTLSANGFQATDHSETYCLVCGDNVEAIDAGGSFDLEAIAAATGGANCQIFAINYNDVSGVPVTVGSTWSTEANTLCTSGSACWDYIGMNLDITPLTQASTNGVSTPVDWTDVSDGCAGAQQAVNAGGSFTTTVNNWCTPDFGSPINARPDEQDDLITLMGADASIIGRVPCVGTMDLTQNPIFYTVECVTTGPSQLDVSVTNPGGAITMIEAALYGPVDPGCPTFTGGTFIDCDDSGAGSQSGDPLGNLALTTNANPGEVFLVIVDTEGREQFTIESTVTLLGSTLVEFTGRKEGDVNILEWETAKEENTSHFDIERSVDGVNFEPYLTEIVAAGNSSTPINYDAVDEFPGVGTKYYRLKTIDTDGSYEYSNIVALARDEDPQIAGVHLFPNPNNGTFFVEFIAPNDGTVEYTIHDVIGQQIMSGQHSGMTGFNRFEINLGDVPEACYMVTLSLDGYRVNRRVIKQ